MNISIDEDFFEECQEEMLHYIAKRIRSLLEEKGVDKELIYDITGDMAFEFGAILDGSAVMGTEEKPILPVIAFSKSEEERNSLVVGPDGSCFHEMAFGFVDQVFEEE